MSVPENSVEQLDQIANRIAKERRLAHITRGDLAFEAGVSLEILEQIERGRPVAHEDLIAVLDVVAGARRRAETYVPQPRTESMPSQVEAG